MIYEALKWTMPVTFILIALNGCSYEKTESDLYYENRRYMVVCVDQSGKEFYKKVAYNIDRNGGNITVLLNNRSPYIYDVVTGTCKAEVFDARKSN